MKRFQRLFDEQPLSVKMFFFALVTCFCIFSVMAAAKAAATVGLKQNAIIDGPTITLGDIFYNLPRDADKVLGPAPQPGTNMTLNARTLLRIAVALDLPWRPATSADSITLSSAATVIGMEDISAAVRHTLKEQGLDDSFNLLFAGERPQIILPQDQPGTFDLTDVSYDPQREWFKATVVAPSAEHPMQRINVTGSVERMIDVPVLRENIRAGTVIGKRDIDFIQMRAKDVSPEFAMNIEELDGTTPRRMIMSGKPIKMMDIEAPRIVSRGESVTMVFQEGMLTLTAKGKALENGTKGDIIRVMNTNSNRTVEGTVTASREVTVQSYE